MVINSQPVSGIPTATALYILFPTFNLTSGVYEPRFSGANGLGDFLGGYQG